MRNLGIIGIMLLMSGLYTIFVWWLFNENEAAITGKTVKCGPGVDTISTYQPKDTLKGFAPISEHSQLP